MKKALILFSVAALALVSCAKVSDKYVGAPESHEIAFQAITTPNTKAAIQGTTFPTTNNMEVVAYQTDPTPAGNYFAKTTFSYSDPVWKGTTARYWPLSAAKLNFFAVSGAGVTASHITIDGALNKDATATVAYTAANSYDEDSQSDIMYAFGRGFVTQSGNALYFNRADAGADVPVALTFKHAMSLVKFQVKAANAASEAITINSITLNNASYTGSLALTNNAAVTANTGDVTTTVTWTPDDVVATVTVPNISDLVLDDAAFAPADGGAEGTWASLIIVPNATKGFDSFTVNYTFDGHSYAYTYTPSPVVPVAAGHVYTYKLTFTLHEITVSPSVTLWDNTDYSVSIP